MIKDLQIGEPVEHRGIVIAPLFPRHDPIAAYVTLEALADGLRIREVDEGGTVSELVAENPLEVRQPLRGGARRSRPRRSPRRRRAPRGSESADERKARRVDE